MARSAEDAAVKWAEAVDVDERDIATGAGEVVLVAEHGAAPVAFVVSATVSIRYQAVKGTL